MIIDQYGNLKVKSVMENYDFSQFYPSATFSRSSTAFLSDGTSVASGQPRYENGKFGKGILVEEGTTNLVLNSDFEIIKAAKERVFFDDFNRTPTLTFTRGSTNSSKTLAMDFRWKVSGSLVENPHVAKQKGATTFDAPATFASEANSTHYGQLSSQDNSSFSPITSANGLYAQALFSFDILTALKRANLIPQSWDVATLKTNITSYTMTWWGYGVGSNAGISTNGATYKVWNAFGSSWATWGTNTSSSPTQHNIAVSVNVANYIDSNGFAHLLVHSTHASNGTIASTIYTDYIKLDVTVNSPDLARNPETGAAVEPSEVRYVNGRFQNLLSKNQSDVETDVNGWSGYRADISKDTTISWQGSSSIKAVANTASSTFGPYVGVTSVNRPNVVVGKTYIASGYVLKGLGNYSVSAKIEWKDVNGAQFLSSTGTAIALSSSWQRIYVSGIAPANADSVTIAFYITTTNSVIGDYFYVDGVQLEEAIAGQTTPTDWRVGGSGKAVFIEDGTTNVLLNPSFEEELTSWNIGTATGLTGSASIVTTKPLDGTKAVKIEVTSSTSIGDISLKQSINIPAGNVITASAYVQEKLGNIESRLRIRCNNGSGGFTYIDSQSGIGRLIASGTVPSGYTADQIWLMVKTIGVGDTGYAIFDAAQVETKAYATSFVRGTRNAETLTVPTTGMSPTAGTWEQWVYVNPSILRQNGEYATIFYISSLTGGAGGYIGLFHVMNSANWRMLTTDGVTTNLVDVLDSTTPIGWHLFSMSWTGTSAKLYVDGVLKTTINNPKLPSNFGANALIGYGLASGGTYHDAIRASNAERTATEILAYYNATSPLTQLDDKTVFMLNFDSDLDAEATVQAGWILNGASSIAGWRLKGSKLRLIDVTSVSHGDSEWTDIDVSCKISVIKGQEALVSVRHKDSSNRIRFGLGGSPSRMYLQSTVSGVTTTHLNEVGYLIGTEYTVRFVLNGSTGTFYVDGIQKWTGQVANGVPASGLISLQAWGPGNGADSWHATFDDIEVKGDVPDKWNPYIYNSIPGRYACFTSSSIKQGGKAAKFTCLGRLGNPGALSSDCGVSQSAVSTPGQAYTASIWVKGSGQIYWRDDTNAVTYFTSTVFDVPDWTRMTWTTTAPAGCISLRLYITATASKTLWVDCVQIEQKAYATSYHRNDSLTVAATRQPESLKIPTDKLSIKQGTIEFWYKANELHDWNDILVGTIPAGRRYLLYINRSGNLSWDWGVANSGFSAANTMIVANTWYHIALTWEGTSRRIYVNGVSRGTTTLDPTDGIPTSFGTSSDPNGVLDGFRLLSVRRSDEEIFAAYSENKQLASDRFTVASYRFDGNLQSHTDIPMVIKNVNGVETLYLRGSVVQE